ncbi:hypothetical protein GCM10020256_48850 [Streptomyces thermocoprophilus]
MVRWTTPGLRSGPAMTPGLRFGPALRYGTEGRLGPVMWRGAEGQLGPVMWRGAEPAVRPGHAVRHPGAPGELRSAPDRPRCRPPFEAPRGRGVRAPKAATVRLI